MKYIVSILLLILCFSNSYAQTITGKWKTIDDETGEEKSIVEIYEVEGKVYGKIVKVLNAKSENPICDKCEGENKDKPIIGMTIINGLEKDDDIYEGGSILNPSNGKIYKCRLKIGDTEDILQVRGYIAFFYKTQYWKRVNE